MGLDSNKSKTYQEGTIINDVKSKIDLDKLNEEKNTLTEDLKKVYEEYVNSGYYSKKGLEELKKVYDEAVQNINNSTDYETANQYKEQAEKDFELV